MRILAFTTLILFGLFSANTYSTGWSGEATVVSIYALNESVALIELSTFANPDNCQVNHDGHVVIDPSVHKVWFSMFLSAYATQRSVNVYVNGVCQTVWPNTSYAQVGHLRLL